MFGEYPVVAGTEKEDIPRVLNFLGFARMTDRLMVLYDLKRPLSHGVVHFLVDSGDEWAIIVHKREDLNLLRNQLSRVAPGTRVMSDSEWAEERYRRSQ